MLNRRWIQTGLLALVWALMTPMAATAGESAVERAAPSQNLLSIRGLGTVHLGSTVKQARRSGYFLPGAGPCGPRLKPRFGATLVFAGNGRILGVEAYSSSRVRTTTRIGPGSLVRQLRARHPRLRAPIKVRTSGGRGWVQFLAKGDRRLVFLFDTPAARKPRAKDAVQAMMLYTGWKPEHGLFGGC